MSSFTTNPSELQWRTHSSLIKFQPFSSAHQQFYDNMQYPFNVLVKEESPLFPTTNQKLNYLTTPTTKHTHLLPPADSPVVDTTTELACRLSAGTADLHRHREENEKVKNHHCDDCGKSFAMKHHLTSHMKIHAGIRPHMCKECGKTFTHKHCLNTHVLLHSSERPHQCEECKKTFTLKHHLVKHLKVKTT